MIEIPEHTLKALLKVREACNFKTMLALGDRENEYVLEFLRKTVSMEKVITYPPDTEVSFLCIDGVRRFQIITTFGDDGKITMDGTWLDIPDKPRPPCEECIWQKRSAEHDRAIRESVMDEFGILYGEDAKRLHEYLGSPNPVDTAAGKALVLEAAKRVENTQKEPWSERDICICCSMNRGKFPQCQGCKGKE